MYWTKDVKDCTFLSCRGQSELPSPVVRDDEVTVAARRRKKKVACILQQKTFDRVCVRDIIRDCKKQYSCR